MIATINHLYQSFLNRINPFYNMYEKQRRTVSKVFHNGSKYLFSTPNALCKYRADTFSTKEPDTLAWIDTFNEGSVFWDIGANVGLYSIYAGKSRNCSVVSFEPSVFNLEALSRNVFLNELTSSIQILPVALSNSNGVGLLNMSSTNVGGALSTFNHSYGYDGKELTVDFKFSTLSMTMDSVVKELKLPFPKYIKIDVNGIEHLILEGGLSVLESASEILIEFSRDFLKQKTTLIEILKESGFVPRVYTDEQRKRYKISENDPTYNQIWEKPNIV